MIVLSRSAIVLQLFICHTHIHFAQGKHDEYVFMQFGYFILYGKKAKLGKKIIRWLLFCFIYSIFFLNMRKLFLIYITFKIGWKLQKRYLRAQCMVHSTHALQMYLWTWIYWNVSSKWILTELKWWWVKEVMYFESFDICYGIYETIWVHYMQSSLLALINSQNARIN